MGFHDRALQPDDYRAMPDGTLQRLMAAGDRGAGEEFRRRLEQFRKEIEDGVDQELQGG